MADLPAPRPPTTVLLADDDVRFRSLVRGMLEDDGYQVVAEASTATEAVTLAELHRPDVAVLDLVMPEVALDGSEDHTDVVIDLVAGDEAGLRAASELLARLPGTRLVILSSLLDPTVEVQARRLGIGLVEKVSGIDALEAAIEATVAPG